MKISTRILSLVLCLILVTTGIPVVAFSEETVPASQPVAAASENEALTAEPTTVPTAAPTAEPTAAPTAEPTAAPTAEPTAAPTAEPTAAPTAEPTAEPTAAPTAEPTAAPTAEPTAEPTAAPTAEPTAEPTAAPTAEPTAAPTEAPDSAKTKTVLVITNQDELDKMRTYYEYSIYLYLQNKATGEKLTGQPLNYYRNDELVTTGYPANEDGLYVFALPCAETVMVYTVSFTFDGTDELEAAEIELTLEHDQTRLTQANDFYVLSGDSMHFGAEASDRVSLELPSMYAQGESHLFTAAEKIAMVLGYSVNGGETQYANVTATRTDYAQYYVYNLPAGSIGKYTIQSLKAAPNSGAIFTATLPAEALTYEVTMPELTVSEPETVYLQEDITFSVSYLPNIEISATIDGAPAAQCTTDANGKGTIVLQFSKAGEYTLAFSSADGKKVEKKITAQQQQLNLTLGRGEPILHYTLDNACITGTATIAGANATGLTLVVTAKAKDAETAYTAEATVTQYGNYAAKMGQLPAGVYTLDVNLKTDTGKYAVNKGKAPELDVYKVDRELSISIPEGKLYAGETLQVTVTSSLDSSDTSFYPFAPAYEGTATLYVYGALPAAEDGTTGGDASKILATVTGTFADNKVTFTVNNLPAEATRLQCITAGNNLYEASTAACSISVEKGAAQPVLSIAATQTKVGAQLTAQLTVTDRNGKTLTGSAVNDLPLTLLATYQDGSLGILYQGTYGAFIENGSTFSFKRAGRAMVTAVLDSSALLEGKESAPSQQIDVDMATPTLSQRGSIDKVVVGGEVTPVYLNWDAPTRKGPMGGAALEVWDEEGNNYWVNLSVDEPDVAFFALPSFAKAGDYRYTVYYGGERDVCYPATIIVTVHVSEAVLELNYVNGMNMTYAVNETPLLSATVMANREDYSGVLRVRVNRTSDDAVMMDKLVTVQNGNLSAALFGGEAGEYAVTLTSADDNYILSAAYNYQVSKYTQKNAGIEITPDLSTWQSGSQGVADIWVYTQTYLSTFGAFGGETAAVTLLRQNGDGWDTVETQKMILSDVKSMKDAGSVKVTTTAVLRDGIYKLRVTLPENALHETLTAERVLIPISAHTIEIDPLDSDGYYPVDTTFYVTGTIYGAHGTMRAYASAWEEKIELPITVDENGKFTVTVNLPKLYYWDLVISAAAGEASLEAKASTEVEISPLKITSYTAWIEGEARVGEDVRVQYQLKDMNGNPVPGVYVRRTVKSEEGLVVDYTRASYTNENGVIELVTKASNKASKKLNEPMWYDVTFTVDPGNTKIPGVAGKYVNAYPDGADSATFRYFLNGKQAALTPNGELPDKLVLDNENGGTGSMDVSFLLKAGEDVIETDEAINVHVVINGDEKVFAFNQDENGAYSATLYLFFPGASQGTGTIWATKDLDKQYEACTTEKYTFTVTMLESREPSVTWHIPSVVFAGSNVPAIVTPQRMDMDDAAGGSLNAYLVVSFDGERTEWSYNDENIIIPLNGLSEGIHEIVVRYVVYGINYSFSYKVNVVKRQLHDRKIAKEDGEFYLTATLDVSPDQESTTLMMNVALMDSSQPTKISTQVGRDGKVRVHLPKIKNGFHRVHNFRVPGDTESDDESLNIAYDYQIDQYYVKVDHPYISFVQDTAELDGGPVVMQVMLDGDAALTGIKVQATIRASEDAAQSDACTVAESTTENGVYLVTLPEKYWKAGTYYCEIVLPATDEYSEEKSEGSFTVMAQPTRISIALDKNTTIAANKEFVLPVSVLATGRMVDGGTVSLKLRETITDTTYAFDVPVKNSSAQVPVNGLDEGDWSVEEVIYSGSDQFAESQITEPYSLHVAAATEKQKLNVDWKCAAIEGGKQSIVVELKDEDGNYITDKLSVTVLFSRSGVDDWNAEIAAGTSRPWQYAAALPEDSGVWYVTVLIDESEKWQSYTSTIGRIECTARYTPTLKGNVTPKDGLTAGDTVDFTISLNKAGDTPAETLVWVKYNNEEEKSVAVTRSEDNTTITGTLTLEKGGTAQLIARYPGNAQDDGCDWSTSLNIAKKRTTIVSSDENWDSAKYISLNAYRPYDKRIQVKAGDQLIPYAKLTISGMDSLNGAYYADRYGDMRMTHAFTDIPTNVEYKNFTVTFRYEGSEVYEAAERKVTFRILQAQIFIDANGEFDYNVEPNSQAGYPGVLRAPYGGPSRSAIKQANYIIYYYRDAAAKGEVVARGSVPVAEDHTLTIPLVTNKTGEYMLCTYLPENIKGYQTGEKYDTEQAYWVEWEELTPQLTMLVQDAEISNDNPATFKDQVKLRFTLNKDGKAAALNGKAFVTVNGVRYEATAANGAYEVTLAALPANEDGYPVTIALESDTQKIADVFEAPTLVVKRYGTILTAQPDPSDAVLKANRSFTISGKLTDKDGQPMAKETIIISVNSKTSESKQYAFEAQTDADGVYRCVLALPAGEWTVAAACTPVNANYAAAEKEIAQLSVKKIETEIVSAELQNTPSIKNSTAEYKVRVMEKGMNTPLANALVQLQYEYGNLIGVYGDRTNAQGYATVEVPEESLPLGTYDVAFYVAEDADYSGSATVQGAFAVISKTTLSVVGFSEPEKAYTHMPLIYTVKLEDETGAALANRELKYTFSESGSQITGAVQKVVTDANGQAAITVQANTAGQWVLACEYKGSTDGLYKAADTLRDERTILPMPAGQSMITFSSENPKRGEALSFSMFLVDEKNHTTSYTTLNLRILRNTDGYDNLLKEPEIVSQETVSLDKDGKLMIASLPTTKAGDYRIVLTADAKDGYDDVQVITWYTVDRQDTAAEITLSSDTFTVRDQAQATVKVYEATQAKAAVGGVQVALSVYKKDDTQIYQDCGTATTNAEGQCTFTLLMLPAGNYTLKATISESEDWLATSAGKDVSSELVKTALADIDVPAQMNALGAYTITGKVVEEATATAVATGTVEISGMGQTVTASVQPDGTFSATVTAVMGVERLNIAYLANDTFAATTQDKDVTVRKADVTAEMSVISATADDDVQVKVIVKTQDGACVQGTRISITLADRGVKTLLQNENWVTDAKGECTMTLGNVQYNGAPFEVTLSMTETDSTNKADVAIKDRMNLTKGSTEVTIGTTQETMVAGKPIAFTGVLKGNKYLTGTVRVYAQYEGETTKQVLTEDAQLDENRSFSITFTPSKAGRIKLTAEYSGSSASNASSGFCNLIVGQLRTDIAMQVTPDKRYAHLENKVQLVLTDEDGKTISGAEIKLYQRKETEAKTSEKLLATLTTDENGAASHRFTFLTADKYILTAVYEGSLNYSQSQKIDTLSLLEMPLVLDGSWSAVTCTYGDTYSFVGTLLDNAKQIPDVKELKALISLNGTKVQQTTVTVDAKGNIALTVPTDKAGDYRLTLSLPAQNGYAALKHSVDYTVLHRDVTLTATPEASTITTLANGKVNCTVTSALGAAQGVKVQITVNGKNYDAVTDENGSCTITLDRLPEGTYPIAAASVMDERYNADTTGAQLSVRKTTAIVTLNEPEEQLVSNQGFTVTGTVVDEYGTKLTGKVDIAAFGKVVTRDVTEGVFSCTFPPQAATEGESDLITATFQGGELYTNGTKILQVKIYPVYTLHFESNGGTRFDDITAVVDTMIDLTAFKPTRKGYTFQHWYADAARRTRITSVTLTEDTVVYAGWELSALEDVSKDNPYYDDIRFVRQNNLMDTLDEKRFGMGEPVNRALLAETLWRLAKRPAAKQALPCADVKQQDSYAKAAAWCVENGWMLVDQDGLFNPDATVDRVMLARALYAWAASMEMELTVEGDMDAWLAQWTDGEALLAEAQKLAEQETKATGTDEAAMSAETEELTHSISEAYRWAVANELVETDGDALNVTQDVAREQLARVCRALHQMMKEQAAQKK